MLSEHCGVLSEYYEQNSAAEKAKLLYVVAVFNVNC